MLNKEIDYLLISYLIVDSLFIYFETILVILKQAHYNIYLE